MVLMGKPASDSAPRADALAAAPNVSDGRVEDGRGSLGPEASAPFPIPAHRTGHADLRHPALRLASPQGPQRGRSWQAFQTQHAVVPMDRIPREPTIAAPCHLVPSGEEGTHALANIVVDTAEGCDRRPQTEIARPAP